MGLVLSFFRLVDEHAFDDKPGGGDQLMRMRDWPGGWWRTSPRRIARIVSRCVTRGLALKPQRKRTGLLGSDEGWKW